VRARRSAQLRVRSAVLGDRAVEDDLYAVAEQAETEQRRDDE
jgi:hypothetical protein